MVIWLLATISLEDIKFTFGFIASKQLFATTVKLNDTNLLWAQSFRQLAEEVEHITENPPVKSTTIYDDQVASDFSMMTLLDSMNKKVSASVMFLKTSKKIWDTLKKIYSNKQNISRVADLYKRLLSLRQDGHSV